MSLDFSLVEPCEIFSANITHNLGAMARAARIYEALWRPDEQHKYRVAGDLIKVLEKGLADLRSRRLYFQHFDSPNGWGVYDNLVPFVEKVLTACRENPSALIEVSR